MTNNAFCGACGTALNPGHKFCHQCGTAAPVETPSRVAPVAKPEHKLRNLLFVIGGGVLLVPTIVVLAIVSESSEAPVDRRIRERTEQSERRAVRRSDDETEARTFAEQFVRQSLKAPSTADFGPYGSVQATPMGGGAWTVIGYVDAQNSFGAPIRSQWSVLLQKEGDSWRALSVDVR